MARAGRKRTVGIERDASGRERRVRVDGRLVNVSDAAALRRIRDVALAQPHRRIEMLSGKTVGDDNPWRESALGRFCLDRKLRREIHDAAVDYANIRRWWGNAVGKPRGFENATPGTTTEGPSDAKVRGWLATYTGIDIMLTRKSTGHYNAFIRLVVDNAEAPQDEKSRAALVEALTAVAKHMGRLPMVFLGDKAA